MMTAQASTTAPDTLSGWFLGRLPDDLFAAAPEITSDEDEVLIIGEIPDVELPADASDDTRRAARLARIGRFRQETKESRIGIAREAEHLFGRKVSWGATCGGERQLFTTLGVPVMTRLRLGQRRILDTLIDAGVARSRSEALAWCVKLVAENETEWIDKLRAALADLEKVRDSGPGA